MVQKKDIFVYGALGLGALVAWTAIGGASGIGSRIGGGIKSLGDSILAPFSGLQGTEPEKVQLGDIPDRANLAGQVTNVPKDDSFASERQQNINRDLLSLAGLFQSVGSSVKVDVGNQQLIGQGFVQPLGFAFDNSGRLRTGTSGLSAETLAAQAKLSREFGIATFDMTGALSTVGGLVSER